MGAMKDTRTYREVVDDLFSFSSNEIESSKIARAINIMFRKVGRLNGRRTNR